MTVTPQYRVVGDTWTFGIPAVDPNGTPINFATSELMPGGELIFDNVNQTIPMSLDNGMVSVNAVTGVVTYELPQTYTGAALTNGMYAGPQGQLYGVPGSPTDIYPVRLHAWLTDSRGRRTSYQTVAIVPVDPRKTNLNSLPTMPLAIWIVGPAGATGAPGDPATVANVLATYPSSRSTTAGAPWWNGGVLSQSQALNPILDAFTFKGAPNSPITGVGLVAGTLAAGDALAAEIKRATGGEQAASNAAAAAQSTANNAAMKANNLSDLGDAPTARKNLGLGSAAILAATSLLLASNNLADLGDVGKARVALGLGTLATQAAGSVAVTGGALDGVTLGFNSPNGRSISNVLRTYGRFNQAVGHCLLVGSTGGAEVLGGDPSPSSLSRYTSRDSVAMYVHNVAISPIVQGSGTFTATTWVPSGALNGGVLAQLEVGMLIDTSDATKFTGTITGWAADGSSVTVSGWFQQGNTAAGQVPAGPNAIVCPVTKTWAHNSNVFLTSDSYANETSGFELGIFNNKGTGVVSWGFDCVNLGQYPGSNAHLARGSFNYGFSSLSGAGVLASFHVNADAGAGPGFLSDKSSGLHFAATVGGVNGNVFQVDYAGNITGAGLTVADQGTVVFPNASRTYQFQAVDANDRFRLTVGSVGDVYMVDSQLNTMLGGALVPSSANKALAMANGTLPTAAMAGGGVLAVVGGALKFIGGNGTVTTLAAA